MPYIDITGEEEVIPANTKQRMEERQSLAGIFSLARDKPDQRQAHLDAFLRKHPAKGVWQLVYDHEYPGLRKQHFPSTIYREALEKAHKEPARLTDAIDGPGFLFDMPNDRRMVTWGAQGYRSRRPRTRKVFITPRAYELSLPEFENFVVDRLYWRARDLCGRPRTPWRDYSINAARGNKISTGFRVPYDLAQTLDETTYRLLSDAQALLHQVRGGIARGIADSPTVRTAAHELSGLAMTLVHVQPKNRYDTYIIDRSLREINNR